MEKYHVIVNLKNNMYLFFDWDCFEYKHTFDIEVAKRLKDEGEVLRTLDDIKEKNGSDNNYSYYEVKTIYKF